MAAQPPFIYFYDGVENIDEKIVIHTIECSDLLRVRKYIGIAPSPPLALHRAESLFPEKSFVLCPHCCNVAELDKNNK